MTHEKPTPAPVEVTALPCAHCGSEALIGQTLDDAWYAMCCVDHCIRIDKYWRTKAEAIAAWNTRHSAPAGEVVATYRHVKRGTTYQVVGAAELQATAYNVHEGDKLTIYRGQDGKLWARHEDEFHDGRFEQVEGTHPAPPADLMEALKRLLEEYVSNIDSHRLGGFYLDPEKEECVVEARAALAKHGGA